LGALAFAKLISHFQYEMVSVTFFTANLFLFIEIQEKMQNQLFANIKELFIEKTKHFSKCFDKLIAKR
jgi:hypothetical protein